MPFRRRLPVALLFFALIGSFAAVSITAADAAGVPRVTGVTISGQNWDTGKLTVKWARITGATYQVRWATSTSKLAAATKYPATGTSTTSPKLDKCVRQYVQVRAVKAGKFGSWSSSPSILFTNKLPTLTQPRPVPTTNGVRYTWSKVAYASKYRIKWYVAPFGKLAGSPENFPTGWLPQSARSVEVKFGDPKPGDQMMGAAYANAVYAKLETVNNCKPTLRPSLGFVSAFPKGPAAVAGDALRFGTYNLYQFPTGGARLNALASNINARNLQVITLVEASTGSADALISALSGLGETDWARSTSSGAQQQQILYRSLKFSLAGSGTFGQANPPNAATPKLTPWARLAPIDGDPKHQDLFVVAVHLQQDQPSNQSDAIDLQNKHNAGLAAQVLLDGIQAQTNGTIPVISAGDYRYLREPFGDVSGSVEGPPTFVRGGFYDAMNAVTKTGQDYTTVNDFKTQSRIGSDVGSRADYILLKGFGRSESYENLYNKAFNGLPAEFNNFPSDHNLVYVNLVIPFAP